MSDDSSGNGVKPENTRFETSSEKWMNSSSKITCYHIKGNFKKLKS